MSHIIFILFVFAAGACVGSFVNVVVWRMPRGQSIISPPSHCPKCRTWLAWYDNIPVFGWIALRGKCRYCGGAISVRYPIVEAITGGLFVLYYAVFFIWQFRAGEVGPMTIQQDWPMYFLYMLLIGLLLAGSLIDAEHYQIPVEMFWVLAGIGVAVHAFIDMPMTPGALNASAPVAATSAGAGAGLLISTALLWRGVLPRSYEKGAPLLEVQKQALARDGCRADVPDFTRAEHRAEMQKEILFLLPPMMLGALWLFLCWKVPFLSRWWQGVASYDWFSGLLGSLWGAMVGAFAVWLTRILGTLIFGREAMGLGDVHLMFGVGAVMGAGAATMAFFIAPFFGLVFGLYRLIFRKGRELPYGPFLSLAIAFVMVFYCQISELLRPGLQGLIIVLHQQLGL